ncbi:MAG: HD domain-containing protein [Eubacterium sp.]|nr:HD domain-containing protein [Eubacterium sp.]
MEKDFFKVLKKPVALILVFTLIAGVVFLNDVSISALTKERDETGLKVGQTTVLYDSTIGLPTSEANDIAQTSDGFIWIGSYSGLIRYDGNSFYRYDSSYGISSVISLYVDSKERLWIGTNDSGAVVMEGGEFTFYERDEIMTSSSIRAISEDESGNIFIATTQGMVYIDNDGQMHSFEDERLEDKYIYELNRDANGNIYGATMEGDFFKIKNLKVEKYMSDEQLGDYVVSCVNVDTENEGYIYLGTEENVIIHGNLDNDMKDFEIIETPEQTYINYIGMVDGEIWICADDGIAHIDTAGEYQKLSKVDMDNSVDSMLVDYEGNLWFVSSRQGVMKITTSIFADVTRYAGISDIVVNTTYMVGEDLYIGTDTGLIVLGSDGLEKENEMTKMLDGCRIRCIQSDGIGNLWFCTYSDYGLVCLSPEGEVTTYTKDDGFESDRIRTIMEADDGSIVVSCSGGVHIIRDGVLAEGYSTDDGISNTEILSMTECDGKIYLGSDGDGIYVLENGKIIDRIGIEDGLLSEVILREKYDTVNECIWIITSNSIAFLKDGEITTVNNFPYANNFDLYRDTFNNIWVESSDGIYVVSAEEMLCNEEIEYIHYDTNSGLPHVTTANSRSFLSEDGNLYLAGTSGVTMVNINEKYSEAADIRLAVPYVEADDEIIYIEDNTVRISSGVKRLNIYGYALSYSLGNPEISYYLEGFDKSSVIVKKSDLEAASYTNLTGGTYNYHICVLDTLSGEVVNETVVKIVKEKAFYEMWTVRFLAFVILAAIVGWIMYLYFRRKARILERRNKERQTLINEMTHAFAKTIDMKDKYTNGHSERVAQYTKMIAEKMDFSESEVQSIYNIALLHDIGKISIPGSILNKPEALNDDEYVIMKSHAAKGYEALKDVTIQPDLAIGAGYHHERVDGKGYPNGLKGEEIPLIARIIAVADTFDAMYSTRPYRKKMELSEVIDRIRSAAGSQLDENIVKIFIELYEEGKLENINVD